MITAEQSAIDGPVSLTPITPGPSGALEITVPCRTSRTGGPVRRHPITLNADWTVTTPHHLDLERIASAMGGYLSCVDLVDSDVPALWELVQLRARRLVPGMARDDAGMWRVGVRAAGCACERGFASSLEAADHLREPLHVAGVHGVVPQNLARLMTEVERAHGTAFYVPPAEHPARHLVREPDGLARLWDAGLHADLVGRLHDALWPDGPALPALFYLGVVTRRVDLSWIARTLADVPDEDVALWLCWTDTELDRRHPEARTGWLRAGVPRKAIAALAQGAYTPADVARVAAGTRRCAAGAAIALAAWHRAGCHPSADEVVLLDRLGVDQWYEPAGAAIDWLHARARRLSGEPTRTQVGLLLAVCGTRATALEMLLSGVRDPRVAALLMGLIDDEAEL